MRGLRGKVGIVSGGAAGIGRACVERLCQEGVSVTFSDICGAGAETEAELLAKEYNVQFVQGDMADESFCRKFAEIARERWGKINFLVNNAFSFVSKGIDATREDWVRVLRVGPIGFSLMVQNVLESMKQSGGGAIVNISSISAHFAQPNRWTYNSAKGAVNQLTRCMAMDSARYNIRVNTVSPGWIWTNEVRKAANGDCDKWEPIWGKFHLLRRLGNASECAAPIAFLLSDDASFITGTELMIDGGYSAMGPEGMGETSSFVGST